MKAQYGLLALCLAMSVTAQAQQDTMAPAESQQAQQDPMAITGQQQDEAATQAAAGESSAPQMEEQAGFSKGSVVRSAFTSAVENREPTDNLEAVSNDQNQLYFFTELRDMSGQTAKHRWEHDGKVMAEVEFNVKGPRWRVWSSKTFVPGWTGDWKVSVLNGAGEVISEKNFTYETAAASQTGESASPVMPAEQPAQ